MRLGLGRTLLGDGGIIPRHDRHGVLEGSIEFDALLGGRLPSDCGLRSIRLARLAQDQQNWLRLGRVFIDRLLALLFALDRKSVV